MRSQTQRRPTKTLHLQEWSSSPQALTTEQTRDLRGIGLAVDPGDQPGEWLVKPEGIVGAARLGSLNVVIEPHIPVARVLWLLGYANRFPALQDEPSVDPEDDLLDAFAELYLRALRMALKRGLQMGYRTRDEQMMGVRGRLRLVDQARRHFGQVIPAEVTYDDYTADTDANRILKAALRRLQRAPLQRSDLRRRVAASITAFETVADLRFDPRRLPTVQITRLNRDYELPLGLAAIILRSGSIEFHPGHAPVPGLVFQMWRIYEDFLFEALRQHFVPPLQLRRGAGMSLDVGRRVRLKPDLSLWYRGQCVWVGDAKYKRTDIGVDSDIYQLLAYCMATGLSWGSLVYADGHAEARHQVRNGGPLLEVRGLDLSAPVPKIEQAVRSLAEQLSNAPAKPNSRTRGRPLPSIQA